MGGSHAKCCSGAGKDAELKLEAAGDAPAGIVAEDDMTKVIEPEAAPVAVEAEAQKEAEDTDAVKIDEEAKLKEEAEAKQKAEEEAKLKAEEETAAKQKAEEEAEEAEKAKAQEEEEAEAAKVKAVEEAKEAKETIAKETTKASEHSPSKDKDKTDVKKKGKSDVKKKSSASEDKKKAAKKQEDKKQADETAEADQKSNDDDAAKKKKEEDDSAAKAKADDDAAAKKEGPGAVPKEVIKARDAAWKKLPLPEQKEKAGKLLIAAKNGNIAEATKLIEAGTSANGADGDGWTPLMKAAEANKIEMMELLFAQGADPSSTVKLGEWGNNALHHAARNSNTDAVKLLLARGKKSDTIAKNFQGKTPRDYATDSDIKSMIKKASK